MEEPDHIAPRTLTEKYQEHRFLVMIGVVIIIALFLIGVALALYASSGASQLDLSRPGYQSVREQAGKSDSFNGFSASGEIDKPALEQFQDLYNERVKQAVGVESFGGTGMNDDSLSIDSPN